MVIRDKDIQRIYHVLLYCVRIRIALQKIGQEDIPLLERSLRAILAQEISGFETLFIEELREEDLLR